MLKNIGKDLVAAKFEIFVVLLMGALSWLCWTTFQTSEEPDAWRSAFSTVGFGFFTLSWIFTAAGSIHFRRWHEKIDEKTSQSIEVGNVQTAYSYIRWYGKEWIKSLRLSVADRALGLIGVLFFMTDAVLVHSTILCVVWGLLLLGSCHHLVEKGEELAKILKGTRSIETKISNANKERTEE